MYVSKGWLILIFGPVTGRQSTWMMIKRKRKEKNQQTKLNQNETKTPPPAPKQKQKHTFVDSSLPYVLLMNLNTSTFCHHIISHDTFLFRFACSILAAGSYPQRLTLCYHIQWAWQREMEFLKLCSILRMIFALRRLDKFWVVPFTLCKIHPLKSCYGRSYQPVHDASITSQTSLITLYTGFFLFVTV